MSEDDKGGKGGQKVRARTLRKIRKKGGLVVRQRNVWGKEIGISGGPTSEGFDSETKVT